MIDILFDPQSDYQQNALLAWQAIEEASDIIDMPYVRIGSVLDQIIQTTRNFTRDHDIAPRALLQDETDWGLYENEVFSANARKQLRRKRKKLAELGHLEFIEVFPATDPAYARDLVDWMFAHKRVWGERVGKHGHWIYSDRYRSFLCNWITDSNNVHAKIHAILIDKAPIAVAVVSYCAAHVDSIIAGFHSDPRYSKHSPGLILDDSFMKAAFEKRLNVEFGVGSEPYKLFWSKNAKSDVVSYHVPTSLMGSAAVRLWRLRRRAMTHIVRLTKRSTDPMVVVAA